MFNGRFDNFVIKKIRNTKSATINRTTKRRPQNETNIFAQFDSNNISEDVNDVNGSGNDSEEYLCVLRKSDELS